MEMKVDPEQIKTLREARGLSQDELAQACGVSARTIQRIEATGATSLETQRAMAAVFEVDFETLTDHREETAALRRSAERQRKAGYAGVAAGVVGATVGILAGDLQHAGIMFGLVGAMAGVCCVLVNRLSHAMQAAKLGQ